MHAYLQKRYEGTRVGATYVIPVASLSPAELEAEQARLTLQARCSFGQPPPPFRAWHLDEDGRHLHVPRFYGLERFGVAEVDERSLGDAIPDDLAFRGTPTDVQARATSAVFAKHLDPTQDGGTLVSLPCGFGKTVWSIHAFARLRRKACVLVHKAVLRDQWKASFEAFCPGTRVGILQGDRCEIDGVDVTIAMIQTLANRREYDLSSFGVLICDECHHIAAPTMNSVVRLFAARYVIGLSATKNRADGLTPLLHWSLGPEGFHVERDSEPVRVSFATFEGGCREVLSRTGQPLCAVMTNQLAKHAGRNRFLAERIVAYRRAGRAIIVLSDRLEQLTILRTLTQNAGVPEEQLGVFVGSTKERDRAAQLARPIVFCSYAIASEGLDKRELDTLVLATPKGNVEQAVGRIQRPCETKMPPVVLDVADNVSLYVPLRFKRGNLYKRHGYKMQTLSALEAREEDWFV